MTVKGPRGPVAAAGLMETALDSGRAGAATGADEAGTGKDARAAGGGNSARGTRGAAADRGVRGWFFPGLAACRDTSGVATEGVMVKVAPGTGVSEA